MLYFFDARVAVISHGITKEGRVPPREIDLAVERLVGNTQFFLEAHELAPAKPKARRSRPAAK